VAVAEGLGEELVELGLGGLESAAELRGVVVVMVTGLS